MIRLELLSGLVVFGLWIFCLLEVISSHEGELRNLPKLWWLVIVLLFPFAGSVAWLVAGRPRATGRSRFERTVSAYPENDRPGRAAAVQPEDDEEFSRRVRERAEQQRRAYRAAQLEREREEQEKLQRGLERKEREDPDPGS